MIKKFRKKLLRIIILSFIYIYSLFFSTTQIKAATTTKTFSFASTAENFVGNSGGKATLTYDSETGNPAGSLKTDSSGRNNNDISNWTWTGTWEDLGVPAGAIVTQIRVNAGYTRVTAWNIVDSVTIGPYKLKDNLDVDQATLWAGRSPTGTEGSWIAISAQSDQTVPAAVQASNSTIKLYLERSINLGNNPSAQVTLFDDEVSFVITYTAIAVSLTTDGSVSFGTLVLNTTQDTTASGLNDVETVSVDGGPADLDVRSTNFTEGGNTWALAATNGANQVQWEFSKDGSAWSTFTVADTLYSLDTNVAQGQTRNLYLRLTMPTSTNSYNQYGSTVTVVVSSP